MLKFEDASVKNRILFTVEIASRCGQAISANEISFMLPVLQESDKVQQIINSDPNIADLVSTENEFIVLKGQENLFSERPLREKISTKYRSIAEMFFHELHDRTPFAELMAVCGSVAYGSAKKSDDIDLFVITKKNRMWLSFLEALILARAFKIKAWINGQQVDFCLSYIQDRENFEAEIKNRKTPLFAREFLSLYVVNGTDYYLSLLEKADWMGKMFPKLFAFKLNRQNEDSKLQDLTENSHQTLDILNLFIYQMLRTFLSFKAYLRNLRYRKQHRVKDMFQSIITKGSCVYTSERYLDLEKMYGSI